ncbi:MAG: 3'-5' exonuclease, partial [Pseudomonadota bacterium]
PNKPLDPEIVGITGITDEMLKNQRIDDDEVDRIISDAAVVIAHNARFDRPFVEQRWASFEQKAWACSLTQIPWGSLGFESAKLEYLAYRLGFFFHGHRAETDCRAGLEILSRTLQPKGEFALKVLLDEARRKSYRVWAVGAPFEAKDTLKARGYRWNNGENGKPRAWHKDVSEDLYEEEARYLSDSILQGNLDPIVDTISAFNRFSERG